MRDPEQVHFHDDPADHDGTTHTPSLLDGVWGKEARCEALEDADEAFLAQERAYNAKLRAEREAERQRMEARLQELAGLTPQQARQRIRLAWANRVARGEVSGECPLFRGAR